jgi:tetratricopeptide (TPR) repeat protein
MVIRIPPGVLILFVGLVTAGPGIAGPRLQAAQTATAGASIQQRLNRVGTDLFSGSKPVDEAIKELKAILAIDPRLAEGHLVLGVAYRMSGSPDLLGEVKAELIQALDLKPGLVPARTYLAQLYLELGRAASARDTLNEGLAQQPAQPELLALLGETERQMGNPRRSLELTRQVLQANESFAQARYYLSLALLDLGQREDAIKELEQVVQSAPKVADPYLALGAAYIEAARLDAAVKTLTQGTAIDPSRADLRIVLARAYRSRGLLSKADEQLTLAVPGVTASEASPFSQHRIEPDFYLELGLLRMRQGRLQPAAEAFQKVLDVDSKDSNHDAASRRLAEVRKLLQQRRSRPKTGGRS